MAAGEVVKPAARERRAQIRARRQDTTARRRFHSMVGRNILPTDAPFGLVTGFTIHSNVAAAHFQRTPRGLRSWYVRRRNTW